MHFCCPVEINAPCSLAKYFKMRWRLPMEKYWVIVQRRQWGWAACRRERKRFKHGNMLESVFMNIGVGHWFWLSMMGCFSAELSIFAPPASAIMNTEWGFSVWWSSHSICLEITFALTLLLKRHLFQAWQSWITSYIIVIFKHIILISSKET